MKRRIIKAFSVFMGIMAAISTMTLPVHAEESISDFGYTWGLWDCGITVPDSDISTEGYIWVSEFQSTVDSIAPYSERAFEVLPAETDEAKIEEYNKEIISKLEEMSDVDTSRVLLFTGNPPYSWTYEQIYYGKEYMDKWSADIYSWYDKTKQPISIPVTFVKSGTVIKGSDFTGCGYGIRGEAFAFGPFYYADTYDEYISLINSAGIYPEVIEARDFDANKSYDPKTLVHTDMGSAVLTDYDTLESKGEGKFVAKDENVKSGEIDTSNGLLFDGSFTFCDIDGYPAIDDCMYIDPGVNLCMFKVNTNWGVLDFYEVYYGIGEPIAPKPTEKVEEETENEPLNPTEESDDSGFNVDSEKYMEIISKDDPVKHTVDIKDNPETDAIGSDYIVADIPLQIFEDDIIVTVDNVTLSPHQYVITNPMVTEKGKTVLNIDIFGTNLHGTLEVTGKRPAVHRSVVGKLVAGTVSLAIVGGGGYWLFLFLKRKRIKFHGVLTSDKMPNVIEKGETSDSTETWFVPELMNSVNKGEITIADYIETLLGCKVVTLLPLDTEMIINVISADGTDMLVYDDVADEATLFDKMNKYSDIARQSSSMYTMKVHIRIGGNVLSFTYLLR